MKRIIVLALSVVLALALAAPIATAQQSKAPSLASLAGSWWSWIATSESSPLEGSYVEGIQCKGEFVDGVFFLAGPTFGEQTVQRTCTVPANTPLFFPVFNTLCSEAWTNPPDPTPYTECAKNLLDQGLDGSSMFATLDGKNLTSKRIASGSFQWRIRQGFDAYTDNDGTLFKPGKYDAASDGYWVYLQKGLKLRKVPYTLHFGGSFFGGGYAPDVTYTLIVK
jgi:hypothetical protein